MLAALKAGAAYVALDTALPAAQAKHMLSDCSPAVVLSAGLPRSLLERDILPPAASAGCPAVLDVPGAIALGAAHASAVEASESALASTALLSPVSTSAATLGGVLVSAKKVATVSLALLLLLSGGIWLSKRGSPDRPSLTTEMSGPIGDEFIAGGGKGSPSEVLAFEPLIRFGTISPGDIDLFFTTDSVDEAFDHLVAELTEHALNKPGGSL